VAYGGCKIGRIRAKVMIIHLMIVVVGHRIVNITIFVVKGGGVVMCVIIIIIIFVLLYYHYVSIYYSIYQPRILLL
jgi:hypothetical protein